jgi:hypothetical protein
MSHDHEAMYLAVAALDFELSPDEYARMEAGLLECAECADAVASHQEVARLLQRLPTRDASPYVRERVLRAALVPPRQRQWSLLLVAAALLGLLLAAAFAVGAFKERPSLDASVVLPSASAPAHGDEASPGPSTSPEPGASDVAQEPAGPSKFGVALTPDTLAQVVSSRLRIRSEPRVADDSIKYEPLLDVGDRLLVVAGPVVANDYEWYQVTAWRPDDLYASWPVGWVSRGDHDGTPWLRASVDPCPGGTITIGTVVALHPEERVACFGDSPLRLRAYVNGGDREPCTVDAGAACIDGPAWLTGFGGWGAETDVNIDTPSLGGPRLAIDPNGPMGRTSMPTGVMVDLEGAFDHPAAQQCRPGAVGQGMAPYVAAVARLECRAQFVVTNVHTDPDYPVADAPGVTVSGNVRVRSDPGLTGDRFELLKSGTKVWVVDGPVVAADYEWFQVIVPSVDAGDGVPRIGWVAASDHGREPWLAKRTIDCAAAGSMIKVRDLMAATAAGSDVGLACYDSKPIRFQGSIGMSCGVDAHPGWGMAPDWLSGNAEQKLKITDGNAVIVAVPRPGLELPVGCGETDPATYVFDGHFDDPESGTCVATMPDGSHPGIADLLPRYWCRTTLVIDDLTPAAPAAALPVIRG